MKKKKVVISGLIFPFTMLHFFWRAFERRDDVDLFVAGPFTANWIPWGNGMKLPMKYIKYPQFALPAESRGATSKMVTLPWKPDLWIQIDAGWHFVDKPDAEVVAHIQTDPHVLKETYRNVQTDVRFCMQKTYIDPGEVFLPYAYDPEIHFPEDRQKIYDACLIGLHYETRDHLVKRLLNRNLKVYYSLGEVYDVYRQRYNESKISLSWSSKDDLPARVWEAFAMQLPLVANCTQEMSQFFNEGEHYLGFKTVEEAEENVMRLLSDDKLRLDIAQRGYDNVKGETWDKRVETILRECGM